ncbi:MAG TPA: hypothetical protein VGQ61_07440, partial [Candidatus Angelobacter sp.]|nr:hypothetical protein [Candidatus Angelobacter sp.]
MRKIPCIAGALTLLVLGSIFLVAAQTQQPAQPQQPDDIPATDAQSGPCSIELSVTGLDGKPVYAA